jgi:hypothetical protein
MKIWLKGNVTIPPRPRSVGGLIGWARGVNRALAELRDRKIVGVISPGGRGGGSPPLKLTIKQGTAANKFQIIPGYVNFEMPTLATVALDNATPPEVTVSADTWFWVKVVGSFGVGGDDTYVVTIETSPTNATPDGTEITETGFTAFRSIGHVDFTAGSPDNTFVINNVYEGGNMGVDSYGNVNLFWRQ